MNIQIVRQKIREFLTIRVAINQWDLDYPESYYFTVNNQNYPANSAIEVPVQSVVHLKDGQASIKTTARFPYRLTYMFPGQMPYHELPWAAFEGVLSTLHIYSLIQSPDPDIEYFQPADIEDSITVSRTEDQDGDWLIHLNFAFDATFRTTEFPDISDLQPPGYFDTSNPPSLQELQIRINRAKPNFSPSDNSTYTEDSTILINT
ncbi:hypothetical protein [Nostoc sp. UHCC 0870]|uniref:hypothetical protein n=1 Tax=Nostoc sp. UHCC 0870 TaxID=2914041 RepID=UPI001EDE9454|nr:hypothetical protein [Nostoc sp. UHCC 0870]UKO99365.1 hypothetical protein L6494_06530 [Nostoc sp. UHCC 0870]